jgi:protein-S-isoprenylcysteine O-methyltransferase Ste14
MLVLYLRAIADEEAKFERSALADDYREYRRAAGMLWPRWRREEGERTAV